MQPSDSFWLTDAEINSGLGVIKSKVSRYLKDAEILIKNGGEAPHALALYLYAVEEFGKMHLLKDCLTSTPVNGRFAVDKSIFGRGNNLSSRQQAHDRKVQRALQELPLECTLNMQSVIIKIGAPAPFTINSGASVAKFVGTVSAPAGITGILTDTDAPALPFTSRDRMAGSYVDWSDNDRRWISDEFYYGGSLIQPTMGPEELNQAIGKFKAVL